MTPVRLKPAAPRSRVKPSTTEPLCSLFKFIQRMCLIPIQTRRVSFIHSVCNVVDSQVTNAGYLNDGITDSVFCVSSSRCLVLVCGMWSVTVTFPGHT